MPLIDLAFLEGQDSTRESKIAPLGVLKKARNVRIQRDGRLVKRPGYAVKTVSTWLGTNITSGIQALASRGDDRVAIINNRLYSHNPGLDIWRDWGILPEVGAPERRESGRNKNASCINGSLAVVGTTFNGVFTANWIGTIYSANGEIFAIVHDATNGAVRSSAKVSSVTSGQVSPRIVAIGTTLVATWIDTTTSNILFATYDTTVNSATWSAPGTIGACYNGHNYYDVAPYSSTQYLIVFHKAAGIIRGAVCSAAGMGLFLDIIGDGHPTCCGQSGEYASIAWFDPATGNIRIQSFPGGGGNPFGGAAVGPTLLGTSATTLRGPITIARKNNTTHTVIYSRNDTGVGGVGDGVGIVDVTTSTGANSNLAWSGVRLASKAFYRNGKLWFLGVNESNFERVYCLNAMTDFTDAGLQTTLARNEAIPFGGNQSPFLSEVVQASVGGINSLLFAFPYISSGSVSSSATPHLSIDYAIVPFRQASSERFQTAEVGNSLYITGGLLSFFDGQLAHELGFQTPASIISLVSNSAGGSMPNNGVYFYVLTREWYDAQGQKHISGVSDPVKVTLGATHNRVVVSWNPNIQSNRGARWISGGYPNMLFYVRTHIWRTENGGSIFYRITPEEGLPRPIGSLSDTIQTYTDQAADSSIITNPVLYTQGIRGGLSGPLQHDPPPPCKYIWSGRDRVIIGGLEKPDEVRWSKQFFPGEPIEFSEDFGFRKRIPGNVTAVACLDGSWIAFTATRIYSIFGDGPDDSGAGSFTDAAAVPSEVGCIEARSLLETPLGLFFQARYDGLYLLPRGLGAPQWIGFPVKDEMAAFGANARITQAKLLKEQNIAVFTLWDGNISTLNLVFDLRTGKWTTDAVFGGTVAGTAGYVGSAVWSGQLYLASETTIASENAPLSSTGRDGATWFGVSIETNALRPGGMQSDTRTRKLSVLAEYRGQCVLQYELAPDDSQAFPYSVQWTVSGLTVGDPVRREWRLPLQKFGAMRLRISEQQSGGLANDGLAFTGLTFETQQRAGMPRLREGYRG